LEEAALPLAVAAAYYVSCLAGFALRYPSSGISFLWPPNAVLLTVLLLSARRRWAGVIACVFVAHGLAHAQDGIPAVAWSVQYFGNVSQALLAAWIVRRLDAVAIHDDLRRLLVFVVAGCILAPAVASIVPAYVYVNLGWAESVFAGWRNRAVSNAVATLGLVPSLLAVWRHRHRWRTLQANTAVEFCGLLLGLAATHRVAEATNLFGLSVTLAATTPFFIWSALRFGTAGLSFVLSTALVLMSTGAPQMSAVAGGVPANAIVGVQLLVMAAALPMFLIAALLQQQRAEHRTLGNVEDHNRAILREYTLALSTGGIGVWDYDIASGRIRVEGTLKRVLGYGDDEVFDTLSDWRSVIFEPDREEVLARLAAVASGTAQIFEMEFRMTHKSGAVRWIGSRGVVTDSIGGRPSRILGTYSDITDRKAAARALTEAHERLARVGRTAAMGELTASLAHELNQPLAAVSTNVAACLRGLDPDQQRETFDALLDVLDDTQRATRIIERTQRLFGNRPAQPTVLDLNQVVREVLRVAAPRLRELHVRVRQTLDPALPNVYADDIQMQQVLFNLVINAAEALQAVDMNGRVIHISSRHIGRHVLLSVKDTGTGLHDADRSRLFEPFYTTKAAGTGMGLAISRSIVRSHGGRLWGVSNVDCGATFRLKLPVRRREATAGVHDTKRVLLVDDHASLRKALTRLLNGYGYEVKAAASVTGAVALAPSFKPDAVVVDISLGDTSGLDLARRIRDVSAAEPMLVIALTAHDDEELRQACLASGFDGYLVKQTQIPDLPMLLERRRT
jgi:PAS domain S-box-containing protein